MQPYQNTQSVVKFKGVIVDVAHDTITLPNGKTALREVVLHADGAAVLPIDNDGNMVFVRQYRHPVGDMILEIPAGMVNKGENTLECATRELEEEIGYKSKNISLLTRLATSPGYCDENIYIYLATDLEKSKQNLDEEEFIEVETYSAQDALRLVSEGKIYDAKTVTAILAYCLKAGVRASG